MSPRFRANGIGGVGRSSSGEFMAELCRRYVIIERDAQIINAVKGPSGSSVPYGHMINNVIRLCRNLRFCN